MLEQEGAFYIARQAEFQEKYPDKWLVIGGESLFGVYDTLHEAAESALGHFKPGEFIIHRPADDGRVIEIGPVLQYVENGQKSRPAPAITIANGDLVAFPYA